MKRFIALLFIFSLVSQHTLIHSQTNYQLVLTKKNNPKKSFIVNTKKKVSIYYTDSLGLPQKQKGLITVKDTLSFYCDTIQYQLNQINKIHASTNSKTNQIVAGGVAATGLGVEAIGIIAFILGNQNTGFGFTQLVEYIVSVFFISAGIAILLIAAVVASTKTDYFDLQDDWNLTIE